MTKLEFNAESDGCLPAQRRERIVALCAQQRFVSVRALAQAVGASVPTVQRDLVDLDRQGVLRRVRGGAMAVAASGLPVPVAQRSSRQVQAKGAIGRLAAGQLTDPGLIFLGSGTTVLCLLDHLDAARHRRSQFVTNAYAAARRLAELDLNHLLLPGRIITAVEATVGEYALATLERFRFDAAVIGFQGMDAKAGLTDADASEALLKSQAVQRSGRVIGVADSSKWSTVAPAKIADLRALACLVTHRLPAAARGAIRRAGVRVVQRE
jgi:DeoR family fructose operon transcriptional repressor